MRRDPRAPVRRLLWAVAVAALLATGCATATEEDTAAGDAGREGDGEAALVIGGIPDQDQATLERKFALMSDYLSAETGLEVSYTPSTDYAAVVTAFRRGDIQLAWYGGLTGVQARAAVPGAEAIAQRPRDAEFHSRFIVSTEHDEVGELGDLEGLSFTFGSESSTSGHLMPRHFLLEAGIDPDEDFEGEPNFSGSHDRTYKLVESGAFDAGALNEAVWEAAVSDGKVDTDKVRDFFTTPAYFDYNWTIHPTVDETFGEDTAARIRAALLDLRLGRSEETDELLELWNADGFIATETENYETIRDVAEQLGIIR